MDAKNEPKEVMLEVKLPDSGYPRCMFFNRFRIQREKAFVLLRFGMDSETDGLLDHYSCVISYEALENNKASLLDYLSRSFKPQEKPALWSRAIPVGHVDAFDMFTMSFYKVVAETVLSLNPITVGSFLAMRLSERGAEHKDAIIKAHPIVLLRCLTTTQMQFIVALYEE